MTAPTATQWREVVQARVGGFFRNTFRTPGLTCFYCTGPSAAVSSSTGLCARCAQHRWTFGDELADLAVPLTYAQDHHPEGVHQSRRTAYAYKQVPPAQKSADDMRLMIVAATWIHGPCIAAVGGWWDAVTFVPSTRRPPPLAGHPTAELARSVSWNNDPQTQRLLLEAGPDFHGPDHQVLPGRFRVAPEYRERITGRHVLVVDDTWVSGGKMQSAAIALKRHGARRVTALSVTRWLRWDWPDHQPVLGLLSSPYDPLRCPVHGGHCTPPR